MKRIASGKEMSGIRQAIEEQEIIKMAELHRKEKQNENTSLCLCNKEASDDRHFHGFEIKDWVYDKYENYIWSQNKL